MLSNLAKYGAEGREFGTQLLNTVISTSLIPLFIGSISVKYALTRAGGMEIKEEKIILSEHSPELGNSNDEKCKGFQPC